MFSKHLYFLIKVWPYLFSHYPFESTMDERIKIDHTTTERYHQLTSEWRGAEEIVMQIEIQHSNNRKNTLAKLLNFTSETTHNATETTLTSIKNVLASIPEKISFTHHNALERKDSALSNDVFYEVKFTKKKIFNLSVCKFYYHFL